MNCKNPICQADRDTMHEANAQLQADKNHLRELLAAVNADGGHRAEEVGIKQAVEEACAKYYGMQTTIDRLHARIKSDRADEIAEMLVQSQNEKHLLDLQVRTMREAIERAIKDSESGIGWGPDVTVVEYLRKALKGVTE